MADAAGVNLDTDLPWTWFRDLDVGDFELRIRRGDAGDLHCGHVADITPGVRCITSADARAAEAVTPAASGRFITRIPWSGQEGRGFHVPSRHHGCERRFRRSPHSSDCLAGTASAQTDCPDVHWIGAAGSGERTPAEVAQNDGMGRVVYQSLQELSAEVQKDGRTLTAEAVEYPAVEAPGEEGGVGEWLGFIGSVDAGSAALGKQYEGFVQRCPASKVVLAGYSQGAMVVHRNLRGARRPAPIWPRCCWLPTAIACQRTRP